MSAVSSRRSGAYVRLGPRSTVRMGPFHCDARHVSVARTSQGWPSKWLRPGLDAPAARHAQVAANGDATVESEQKVLSLDRDGREPPAVDRGGDAGDATSGMRRGGRDDLTDERREPVGDPVDRVSLGHGYDIIARERPRESRNSKRPDQECHVLELRPICENCAVPLPPASTEAMICSYECTFCRDCVDDVLGNVCPNCGGGFVPRPIRPSRAWRDGTSLAHDPPATTPKHRPVDPTAHAVFAEPIRSLPPERTLRPQTRESGPKRRRLPRHDLSKTDTVLLGHRPPPLSIDANRENTPPQDVLCVNFATIAPQAPASQLRAHPPDGTGSGTQDSALRPDEKAGLDEQLDRARLLHRYAVESLDRQPSTDARPHPADERSRVPGGASPGRAR